MATGDSRSNTPEPWLDYMVRTRTEMEGDYMDWKDPDYADRDVSMWAPQEPTGWDSAPEGDWGVEPEPVADRPWAEAWGIDHSQWGVDDDPEPELWVNGYALLWFLIGICSALYVTLD